MRMLSKAQYYLAGEIGSMRARDDAHECRAALAAIVSRHTKLYARQIVSSYYAKVSELTTDPVEKRSTGPSVKQNEPTHGVKVSTALAKLIGLPAYHNEKKGKPEPAKHLIDFIQNAGPAHFDKILSYFRDQVITPEYRAAAPTWIKMAIYQVFDMPASFIGASDSFALDALVGPHYETLSGEREQALCSPHAVIAASEETLPQFTERASA